MLEIVFFIHFSFNFLILFSIFSLVFLIQISILIYEYISFYKNKKWFLIVHLIRNHSFLFVYKSSICLLLYFFCSL